MTFCTNSCIYQPYRGQSAPYLSETIEIAKTKKSRGAQRNDALNLDSFPEIITGGPVENAVLSFLFCLAPALIENGNAARALPHAPFSSANN